MKRIFYLFKRLWRLIRNLVKGTSPIVPVQVSPQTPLIRYLNMPKRQPCPFGHGWKKRVRKTIGGATYSCGKCGEFFVRGYV